MAHILFKNAKVVNQKEIFEADVTVRGGKIEKVFRKDVSKDEDKPAESDFEVVYDLENRLYLLPGLIDAHVHFRTPGMTEKEDWITGSKAALAGGVTTVLDMPNTNPPTVDAEHLQKKQEAVAEQALINYGFFAGANHDNLEELTNMKGIAGVKIFMGSSTGSLLIDEKDLLEKFMEEMGKCGQLVAIHAEDEDCIQANMEMNKGNEDPRVHSVIRSPECAHKACKEAMHLARKYNTRVHVCHVSTEKELECIKKFKTGNVTCEVTPNHLFLSDKDYSKYGNFIKVNPPVREQADQVALWAALKDGTVDIIATDHAPHLLEEKQKPYPEAPSGIPGVQTMLPLLLDSVNKGLITLERIVRLCSYNPAKIFGIKNKGKIEEGYDADLTVVDLDKLERICHQWLWTKVNWSPYHGWILKGYPVMTFVNGNLMYEWREKFGSHMGRPVVYN
jgi:dihydroorotase